MSQGPQRDTWKATFIPILRFPIRVLGIKDIMCENLQFLQRMVTYLFGLQRRGKNWTEKRDFPSYDSAGFLQAETQKRLLKINCRSKITRLGALHTKHVLELSEAQSC